VSIRLRAGTAPDQYHAFTARLAASGYQTTTMRVVAGCILALGLPALLAGVAPHTPPWPGFRVAYGVIALMCIALAVPWLRYRWPTRRESAAVVIVGTLALALGCLVTIDPIAGMVIASAFTFILGFTALFHNAPLLMFAASVSALTLLWLMLRIAAEDVATAIAVTTPVVLLCVVVTFGCRTIATVGAPEHAVTDVEPITGLLNREAFYDRAATLIGARHREDDRYFVLAVVGIDNLSAIYELQGPRGTTQARVAAGQALRETVRRDAVLGHAGDAEFLIAEAFTIADPRPLVDRVLGAVAATPSGITASVGVVSTGLGPLTERPPQESLDEIVALATAAMREARGAGGNEARYLLDPPLAPM
jgi:GGDEF domain-containing protein